MFLKLDHSHPQDSNTNFDLDDLKKMLNYLIIVIIIR
jgi:hypothetical protein